MALHDWSKVDHGFFHDFHNGWLGNMKIALNNGVLPDGFFAMTEQHSEGYITDVSTYTTRPLHKSRAEPEGIVALAEPATEECVVATKKIVYPGRRLVIRESGDRRIVAMIELVSPANKDRREPVGMFAGKIVEFLKCGVHVLVIDILPPNRSTPHGIHASIWSAIENRRAKTSVPNDRPFVIASYRAQPKPVAYLNYAKVGRALPSGPLYLDAARFAEVPLNETYQLTYNQLPKQLKAELR
jgi:hypothetical protein